MPIQVGDHVRMRFPEDARRTDNVTFEVMVVPLRTNNAPTWWELKGDTDGLTYVFTMLFACSIEPPP
jgi:hypothetical protein